MKQPIEMLLDKVEWKAIPDEKTEHTGLYATHEAVLELCGHKLRCYQLNDGQRVFDAEDVAKFFEETNG